MAVLYIGYKGQMDRFGWVCSGFVWDRNAVEKSEIERNKMHSKPGLAVHDPMQTIYSFFLFV